MKKIIITLASIILPFILDAQNCNPFVSQGIVSPSILYDVASSGTGQLSFTVGNNGIDPIPLISNQEMLLTVTLSRGVPNNVNPLTAIAGSFATHFNWLYDAATNTYQGTQNQTIPSGSTGDITIQYQVVSNSIMASPQNGFNVNITPPAFVNGINSLVDDQVSIYTWTELKLATIDPYAGQTVNVNSNDHVATETTDAIPSTTSNVALENGTISFYPNPAVDYLNIKINALSKDNYTISLIDMVGNIILKTGSIIDKGTKTIRVLTAHIASGIYTVKVTSRHLEESFKIRIDHK